MEWDGGDKNTSKIPYIEGKHVFSFLVHHSSVIPFLISHSLVIIQQQFFPQSSSISPSFPQPQSTPFQLHASIWAPMRRPIPSSILTTPTIPTLMHHQHHLPSPHPSLRLLLPLLFHPQLRTSQTTRSKVSKYSKSLRIDYV